MPPIPRPPSQTHALRLTFAYRGNTARLIRAQRVAMKVPAVVTPTPARHSSGFWFEIRNAKGALLYHRPVHDPIQTDIEVFSDRPEQSITRIPVAKPEGEFTLLVPDLAGAHSFHFFGPPPSAKQPRMQSSELIHHSLKELRQFLGTADGNPGKESK